MYRILRNNKEQGPYSLEELLQLSLRPLDLIWVEGRSVGWRYPSEIDSLRSYVPVGAEVVESEASKSSPDVTSLPPENLPTYQEPEENELTAAMLEQKANAIYQRIQAYNAQCEKDAQGVQTKYARSLEDLKQDYADWLHNKKKKKSDLTSGKAAWMALGAINTAFIMFIVAGRNKEFKTPNTAETLSFNQVLPISTNTSAAFASTSEIKRIETQPSVVDFFIDSVRKMTNKQVKLNGRPSINKQVRKITIKPSIKQIIDSISVEIPSSLVVKPKEPRLLHDVYLDARYTQTKGNNRVKELQVTVHNSGTKALQQVSVDVFYYRKGERWFDKETLYFNNIGPGNSHTLTKQGNKKAIEARFQLGAIGNN